MTLRISSEEVQRAFLVYGATLTSPYKNNAARLNFLCSCGNPGQTCYANMKSRGDIPRCKQCRDVGQRVNGRMSGVARGGREHTTESVRAFFLTAGAEFLDEYVNTHRSYAFRCKCGNQSTVRFGTAMRGRIRCEDCWKRETQIGPSHPRWDSDKTQQEREAERGLLQKVWSREVLRRANYTCAVSGKVGGSLEAHHLFNWNDYPNLRGDPGNGVALQRSLHKKFHALYGQKLNTPEQFEEFRRTVSVP